MRLAPTDPQPTATLDRARPERPAGSNSGTQRWRELLFVHWSYPIEVIRPLVPKHFELDVWEGRAWVGVVPFRMEATRPSWLPRRAAFDFLETNVRTYVIHDGKPGVFFLSLEASSWLAVRAARLGWSLPYHHAEMDVVRDGDRVAYGSQRKLVTPGHVRGKIDVVYDIGPELGPSTIGTLQHWLLERYYLFVEHRGRVMVGQVSHAPYPARKASLVRLEQDLLAADGILPDGRFETVHYSDGVEVEVFGPS